MGIQRGTQTRPASSSRAVDPLVQKFGQLNVLDDLIYHRASDAVQRPILAYPSCEDDAALYEFYTGRDLDDLIDQTVMTLIDFGFKPVCLHFITIWLMDFNVFSYSSIQLNQSWHFSHRPT